MTRTLKGLGVPRDETDGTNYPFDRIKNDTTETSKDGTPLCEATLGDVHQGALEIIRRAGMVPDDLPDKKGSSQIADAVGFLSPVMVIKVGYDSTVKVIGGSYKTGYTAAYTTSLTLTGAVANKLTISKDGSTSTENYFVDVTIISSAALKEKVTAGASHSSGIYFDNDSSNIHISGNGGSYSDADLQKVDLIIKVFKA